MDLPGWSHCGEIGKTRVCWYPFEEYSRKIYFAARNRTIAAKQCERLQLNIRDLDGGSNLKSLVPASCS